MLSEAAMTVPLHVPILRRSTTYLLLPLAAGAVVAVLLGVYGRIHQPTGQAIYTGPFASMIVMKVWLAAIALGLALVQLFSALLMYGRLPWPAPDWIGAFHRGIGSLAFIVTLPVAFHCLWALGFQGHGVRVLAHSLFGCLFYGAFVAKVLTLTNRRVPGWALPWVAGLLFSALVTAILTSAGWYLAGH
jgi:hypothetical protein